MRLCAGWAIEMAGGPERLGRVLVADDEAANTDMLSRRLARRGYEVVATCDPAEVEALVADHEPDILLLDWMMPGRNGRDVLEALRTRIDKDHLPVIVVTAMEGGATAVEALKAGANDYVTKPIELSVLLARMEAQLERRRATLALEGVTRTLERTVAERTADLVEANRSLQLEVCERRLAENRAQALARHDALTGLANRRWFLERVAELTREGESFAVVYADLDRFKPINDLYGHAIGDQVLLAAAGRLNAVAPNAQAARLGGDEFALIVPHTDEAALSQLANKICAAMATPFPTERGLVQIGASLGAARFPQDAAEPEALLRRADAAMMQAKSARAGFVCFGEALQSKLQRKARLEADLREAIAGDRLTPCFQPIVDLDSGQVIGFELLSRWRHDELGLLSPSEFIANAEEAGLIDELFWSVLRAAMPKVLAADPACGLSVNVSPMQVRDKSFAERLLRVTQEVGFAPERLWAEVTETSMIQDMENANACLRALRDGGVQIALDDFGTGYSSLAMLHELPLDKIKIDQSFVRGMKADNSAAKIVDAVIRLGEALHLSVVAEGVETLDCMAELMARGCRYGQGFLFGRPEPEPQMRAQFEFPPAVRRLAEARRWGPRRSGISLGA